jgi:hypothetical protein
MKRRQRLWFDLGIIPLGWVIGIVFALMLTQGCASKKLVPETPKAAAGMKADAVMQRVYELERSVIAACGQEPQCAPNSLDTPLARAIVQSCVDMAAVLRVAPEGWQAAVRAIWAQIRPKLSMVTQPAIMASFGVVDALLGGL